MSATRYHDQLSLHIISGKTNDLILKKIGDRQTNGQTDGQMDKSDFIGCCGTNVYCQKIPKMVTQKGSQIYQAMTLCLIMQK